MAGIPNPQPLITLMVEPHPADPSTSCWRLVEDAPPHTPVADGSIDPDFVARVKTMICADGARPAGLRIPPPLLRSIEAIGLVEDHANHLDIAAFPKLRLIFDRGDTPYYTAQHLERGGRDILKQHGALDAAILQNRAKIQYQVRPALPSWMRDVVDDPASQVELKIRISMDFRTAAEQQGPMQVQWIDGNWEIVSEAAAIPPANLVYCWRAGRPSFGADLPALCNGA